MKKLVSMILVIICILSFANIAFACDSVPDSEYNHCVGCYDGHYNHTVPNWYSWFDWSHYYGSSHGWSDSNWSYCNWDNNRDDNHSTGSGSGSFSWWSDFLACFFR